MQLNFRKITVTFLFLSLFFCSIYVSIAAEPIYNFKHFKKEDGLSHNIVETIIEDEEGFIWIGTEYGLNRFNGIEFQTFFKESHGLSSNEINQIFKDDKGWLWLIHHAKGGNNHKLISVDLFNPYTFEVVSIEKKMEGSIPFDYRTIDLVFQIEGNQLVFLDYNGNGWVYKGNSEFSRLKLPTGFKPIKINDRQSLWMRGENEVLRINTNGEIVQSFPMSEHQRILDIVEDGNGGWWIGHQDKNGTHKVHLSILQNGALKSAEFTGQSTSEIYSPHSIILPNKATGTNWIVNPGLTILDKNLNTVLFKSAKDWGIHKTNAMMFDRQNLLWVGGQGGLRMVEVKKTPFQTYLNDESITSNYAPNPTRALMEYNGNLLVSTGGGIFKVELTNQKTDNFSEEKIINIGFTFSIYKEEDGSVWLVERDLLKIDNSLQLVPIKTQLPGDQGRTRALYKSPAGKWWIGRQRGLSYSDDLNEGLILPYQQLNEFQDLKEARVEFLDEYDNFLWIASSNGLYQLDFSKGIVGHYWPEGEGQYYLPTMHVQHFLIDEEGIFWIATADAGLIKWDKSTGNWTQINRQKGLLSNDIYSVYMDDFNHLWLSTETGLVRLNKETFQVRIFLKEDGIAHNEFNRSSHYQNEEGRIFFGGLNGVTTFHPKDFRQDSIYDAQLNLSNVQVFNGREDVFREITAQFRKKGKIILNPEDDFFTLQPLLQDYFFADHARYAYRIEGYLNDWTPFSKSAINIGGLPYGQFLLQVRAHRGDRRISSSILTIPIKVRRPFYLKWWFTLLCIVAGLLLIWQFYRWRTRQLMLRQKKLEEQVAERTAQIKADKQIIEQQAEELKALDKLKSRFFANISHEFRTPLTLILGPIKKLIADQSNKELNHNYHKLIEENARKLMRQIGEILDLSALEAKKLALREQPTPFYNFAVRIFGGFESLAVQNKIQLQFDYQLDTALCLQLDQEKLERIFNNYLSNAINYTPKDGTIKVQFQSNDNRLQFRVCDSGVGIHEEDRSKVFDRFFQARHTTQGGSGIGLAICREYAQLMGGKVWVESKIGKGSCFYFEMPMQMAEPLPGVVPVASLPYEQPTAVIKKEELSTASNNLPVILIVEDNPGLQNYITLELDEYQTIVAGNGQEALEILEQSSQIEFIISDIMMPVMDGYELLKRLKAHSAWQKLPVIMLTARAAAEDKLDALRMGVDDYMTKPFSPEELKTRIANLLQNYQQRKAYLQSQPAEIEIEFESTPSADQVWLKQIEDVVKDGMNKKLDITAAYLADIMTLSERQLLRRIKGLTGLSMKQYTQEVQLQKARHLLENQTYQTIAEVAYDCGFNSAGYFTKVFKKRYGKLPGEYLPG